MLVIDGSGLRSFADWFRDSLTGRTISRLSVLCSGAGAAFLINVVASAYYAKAWSSRDAWFVAGLFLLLLVNLVGTELVRRFSEGDGDAARRQDYLQIAAAYATYLQEAGRQGKSQEVEDGLKTLEKLHRRAQKKNAS